MQQYKHIKFHFKKNDPLLYAVMEDLDFNQWLEPWSRDRHQVSYFKALCTSIIGQQLSGTAAKTIANRFHNFFGKRMTPKSVIKAEDQALRDLGLSWAKVKYVKSLAQAVEDKVVDINKLDQLDDDQVIESLTKVKGIGNWTAEMFLIFTLRREDVFSHGDLGLRKGLEKIYNLKQPSTKRIEKIIKAWSPYKSFGSIALWHSLE